MAPCQADMNRTYVILKPAGWRWRWKKTELQGKFRPWRKTATTYMVQCIDKSPVDDIDRGLRRSLSVPVALMGRTQVFKTRHSLNVAWGKYHVMTGPLCLARCQRWRCRSILNGNMRIYIWSGLTLGACLLSKRCWGLIAVLRRDLSAFSFDKSLARRWMIRR